MQKRPRSRWLSFAGGVSVAWVFLHVLPEIALHRGEFADSLEVTPLFAETVVYGLALFGLTVFYGLERMVRTSHDANRAAGLAARMGKSVLFLHLALFGLLNLLVAYLLNHRESDDNLWSLASYFLAISLHLLVLDFDARQDHPEAYDRYGRWVLVALTVFGWVLGLQVVLPDVFIGCLFAFLAGAIILSVLKEELPEDGNSAFLPFLAGTSLFAFLALVEKHLA